MAEDAKNIEQSNTEEEVLGDLNPEDADEVLGGATASDSDEDPLAP